MKRAVISFLVCLCANAGFGQTNLPKPLPLPGISIADKDRVALQQRVDQLGREIASTRALHASNAELSSLLPDIQIFHKAVSWPLRYNEFYRSNEVQIAFRLLEEAEGRLAELKRGTAGWLTKTGLVVQGYISKIDGSVQPYGLIIPSGYSKQANRQWRLDLWFHGRDDQLTELKFLDERMRRAGEFAPEDTFVLHPYGRYMNAFKFAGETDVFEAMREVRRRYLIDENRIAVRGFSMGGAATWHLAVHHADHWAAAAPGAGFAETAEYQNLTKNLGVIPWYEQKLWHLYNATDYARNLFHCPTIAYSGEIDKQKQAADIMARVMAAENLELRHLIGPGTAHKYEPNTKQVLAREFDLLMQKGRTTGPKEIRFTTWTLRYPKMFWVTLTGLEHHWSRADLQARVLANSTIQMLTTNVSALMLEPFRELFTGDKVPDPLSIEIDGTKLSIRDSAPKQQIHFAKMNGRWQQETLDRDRHLHKRPGLQGPIDDAFMDSFLLVSPTGKSPHPEVERWVQREKLRAIEQWRAQFRGDPILRNDDEVSEKDIAANNLVLWGTPESNLLLKRIASKLPIDWKTKVIQAGKKNYPASNHALVLIFPNPLNPDRYVVLNSGFTFRGFGSNANQTPKLPDYAIIDVTMPASDRAPGGIASTGFFDEQWQLGVE